MWRLDVLTTPDWVARVETRPVELLSDHAHCELRAAASAQALIVKYTEHAALVQRMSAVAREELLHFELVLDELAKRGGTLLPARANPYAEGLLAARAHRKEELLLDRLLVAALIEARSLERFHLLAEHLHDRELAAFYRGLVPSEAAHQALFVELAKEHYAAERVQERLAELRAAEARVLRALPFDHRMHSGELDPAPHARTGGAANVRP
ncbi:MAG: hypothetical protein IPJ77_14790 [Planctomycetes bacterium]|nr:hypothetical protein [Planctomycetota bacterium]